jgi:hypothetical protein
VIEPVPEVRWPVVELLLSCDLELSERLGHRVRHDDGRPFTAAENALADSATEYERMAVLIWLERDVKRARADLAMLHQAEYRDYCRWRGGHRAWVREYGRRPVTPTGPTGP